MDIYVNGTAVKYKILDNPICSTAATKRCWDTKSSQEQEDRKGESEDRNVASPFQWLSKEILRQQVPTLPGAVTGSFSPQAGA